MSKKLTRAELTLISKLLQEASEEFSNHGCNDCEVPNTEENKALLVDMIKANGEEEEMEEQIEEVMSCKKKTIFTYDWWLMSYLADRCKEAAE
jgi:hypothetical protein